MFSADDTIVAIATPHGRGGIGVVRLSGPASVHIAAVLSGRTHLAPRHATLGRIRAGTVVDEAVLTYFPEPHSYTGEDVVEISAHGSPVGLRAIVDAAAAVGARLAAPGEFTLRAFLKGRIDLVQAEAVRDLVDAVTPAQARAAFDQLDGTLTREIGDVDAQLFDLVTRLEASLDFPEEGYHFITPSELADEICALSARLDALLASAAQGRLIREGAHVVIAGRPNTGKSSLFNQLAGAGRAIVTDVPGTTRDLLTEVVDISGIPITLVDTAGVRQTAADAIEAEGISRARAARTIAAAILIVLDRSEPLTAEDRTLLDETGTMLRIVVANKVDLPHAVWPPLPVDVVHLSARTGAGLDDLRLALATALAGAEPLRDVPAITNLRHANLLADAKRAIDCAAAAARAEAPEEFVVSDLTEAREHLEQVTGTKTADHVLAAIFDRFCIGK